MHAKAKRATEACIACDCFGALYARAHQLRVTSALPLSTRGTDSYPTLEPVDGCAIACNRSIQYTPENRRLTASRSAPLQAACPPPPPSPRLGDALVDVSVDDAGAGVAVAVAVGGGAGAGGAGAAVEDGAGSGRVWALL